MSKTLSMIAPVTLSVQNDRRHVPHSVVHPFAVPPTDRLLVEIRHDYRNFPLVGPPVQNIGKRHDLVPVMLDSGRFHAEIVDGHSPVAEEHRTYIAVGPESIGHIRGVEDVDERSFAKRNSLHVVVHEQPNRLHQRTLAGSDSAHDLQPPSIAGGQPPGRDVDSPVVRRGEASRFPAPGNQLPANGQQIVPDFLHRPTDPKKPRSGSERQGAR